MPPGAVLLDPAEVDFIARALEQFAQLMAERRDHNGNPTPSKPSARLSAMTEKLRRAVASLAVTDSTADHGQPENRQSESASVRAPQRDPVHGGRHDIGTGEAARYLGITPNAVRDAARRKRLPARHTGTRWVFDAAAVADHAQCQKARRGR
jgi:excisionase family DNA binding protein